MDLTSVPMELTPQSKENEDPQFQVDMECHSVTPFVPSVEPTNPAGWDNDDSKPHLYPNLAKELQGTDYCSMVLATPVSVPDAVQCVLDINKVSGTKKVSK